MVWWYGLKRWSPFFSKIVWFLVNSLNHIAWNTSFSDILLQAFLLGSGAQHLGEFLENSARLLQLPVVNVLDEQGTLVDQLCRYGAVFPEPGWDTSRNPAPSGICTELRIPRELMRSSTRTVAGWLWLLPPCWQCGIQKSLHQEEWRGVQIDVLLFLVAVVQFSSNIFRQVHPKNPGEIFYIHYLIYIYTYM